MSCGGSKDFAQRTQRTAGAHGEFDSKKVGSKRDPSSQMALLWMTAKNGLGDEEALIVTVKWWWRHTTRMQNVGGAIAPPFFFALLSETRCESQRVSFCWCVF